MKRLSFIIALGATIVVGATDASAQSRRGLGDRGGQQMQRAPMPQPRTQQQPRYEGSGRYRDAMRQQQQRSWGRGDRLPPGYGAAVPNPGQYRLRQPPPGYNWVQNGRDLYLMQNGTGLVLDAIPGGYGY